MLNLTKQEKLVLLFLGFAALVGVGANWYFKNVRPLQNIYQATYSELSPRIDINKATANQLEALPGIGEVLAQRIVDFRQENGPFKRIEDLRSIKGIGPRLFQNIQDRLTVTP